MRVALIYAAWPVTPFGVTWYRLAEHMRAAGLTTALRDAGHQVEEHVLAAEGPGAGEVQGAFELAGAVAGRCRDAIAAGALPVIICGSCAVGALGGVGGMGGAQPGIIWMDAHPDLNTPETSGSGLLDGMALAMALGQCWKQMAGQIAGLRPASPRHVALFGVRSIDPGEAAFIAEQGVPAVDNVEAAIQHLAGCDRVYIHLDMDVHDALQVRTNSFAVPGGPSIETVRRMLAEAAKRLPIAAISVTGFDPSASDAVAATTAIVAHLHDVLSAAHHRSSTDR